MKRREFMAAMLAALGYKASGPLIERMTAEKRRALYIEGPIYEGPPLEGRVVRVRDGGTHRVVEVAFDDVLIENGQSITFEIAQPYWNVQIGDAVRVTLS